MRQADAESPDVWLHGVHGVGLLGVSGEAFVELTQFLVGVGEYEEGFGELRQSGELLDAFLRSCRGEPLADRFHVVAEDLGEGELVGSLTFHGGLSSTSVHGFWAESVAWRNATPSTTSNKASGGRPKPRATDVGSVSRMLESLPSSTANRVGIEVRFSEGA